MGAFHRGGKVMCLSTQPRSISGAVSFQAVTSMPEPLEELAALALPLALLAEAGVCVGGVVVMETIWSFLSRTVVTVAPSASVVTVVVSPDVLDVLLLALLLLALLLLLLLLRAALEALLALTEERLMGLMLMSNSSGIHFMDGNEPGSC